jgi:hypothetical protein
MGRAKGMSGAAVATAIRDTDEAALREVERLTVVSAIKQDRIVRGIELTLPPAVISAPKRKVTVKIENGYECGEEFDKVVKVAGPTSTDEDYLDEWWNDEVFPHTGGHHCDDCDSDGVFECTITEDTEAPFVGLSHEWEG